MTTPVRKLLTLLAASLSAALVSASLAAAQVSAPTVIGSASLTTGINATLTITFTGSAAVGDLVAVQCGATNSATLNTVGSDSKGNAYTLGTGYAGGLLQVRNAYAVLTTAIAAGDTLALTFNSSNGRKLCSAVKVSGMQTPTASVRDLTGAGANGTSTTPGFTTTTFSQADTLVLASTMLDGSAASSDTWTEDANFTAFPTVVVDGRVLRTAYRIVSSTAAITYAPTNSASRTWTSNYDAYKGFVAGGVCVPRGLLGVGC